MDVKGLDLSKAPSKGQMLAYSRTKVFYEKYQNTDEVEDLLAKSELLEIHLFDTKKEYRAIISQSKRYKNGFIEYVSEIKDDDENSFIFKETLALEKKFGEKIDLLNCFKYDECGMIQLDDFRLVTEEK